ncbi:hypothetical protein CLAFUW4_11458 [Fulvia fulva]|uniref:Methyltransferase OMS1, mitochondrial n=1 Tax=Passalora fulva TaxID=5499 RepID=A0A9Q8PBZ1_PASFU|nr:Methyltransferase OMS1, mitochondrial [Fulvia fulva]KAK4619509.1 hypothetical protein CLAFUR4_11464 [Fulvia fulva]KAK4620919.1 hypothetical protein CLAFUR0_11472 [Fulvia fulva]UJO19621.1 Methyltransferase OMS1, mitochondrial [Fulvia fulva]WPV16959.1 hypothetical protein CLAFUW4_11458 [Fulvia fulva]WPV31940.1 hypothetical protein CLAFUW7_11454 [Fulvia fulva]
MYKKQQSPTKDVNVNRGNTQGASGFPTVGPPGSAPPAKPEKSQAIVWTISSLLAGGIAFYCANLYVAADQPCQNPAIKDVKEQKDVAGRYDYTADSFDSEVGLSEWLMGVNGIRKALLQTCTGHVLEVSCGTGRNLGYYDIGEHGRVDSLTFVDLSPQMVEVCRKKFDALFGNERMGLKSGLSIRFLPGSALGQMPLAPTDPPKKYDTIIQTMGLCSTDKPVEIVANMMEHLDTANPEARILLLEHGRSYRDWLNNILDNSAEKHAEIHGCWFNRDIGALVEEAAGQVGLEVTRERRHHLGTTWVFELRPKQRHLQNQNAEVEEKGERGSWFGWFK